MTARLPRVSRGNVIRADHVNSLAARLRAIENTNFDPRDFDIEAGAGGRSVRLHKTYEQEWFKVLKTADTEVTIGEGWGQYAATVSRISDGTETVTGLSTNGVFIIRAVLDLAAGTWSFDSVAFAANVWSGGADATRTWALARVTVASNVIDQIEQLTREAVLYESRA